MCDIRKYPELYSRADWFLRIVGMDPTTYGYAMLRRAIVVWKVEGKDFEIEAKVQSEVSGDNIEWLQERLLIQRVEEIAPMDIAIQKMSMKANRKRSSVEQAMIEELRSISNSEDKKTILEFVRDVAEHLFAN